MAETTGLIEQYAQHLERKASGLVLRFTVVSGFVGALLGGFPLFHTSNGLVPHHLGYATLMLGAAAGAYLGWSTGERRAVEPRLQAQLALRQLQVEQTLMRGAVARPAALAPAAAPVPAPAVPAPVPVAAPAPPPAPVAPPAPAPAAVRPPAPAPAPVPVAPPPMVQVAPTPPPVAPAPAPAPVEEQEAEPMPPAAVAPAPVPPRLVQPPLSSTGA